MKARATPYDFFTISRNNRHVWAYLQEVGECIEWFRTSWNASVGRFTESDSNSACTVGTAQLNTFSMVYSNDCDIGIFVFVSTILSLS
jgi:hypothetical protein